MEGSEGRGPTLLSVGPAGSLDAQANWRICRYTSGAPASAPGHPGLGRRRGLLGHTSAGGLQCASGDIQEQPSSATTRPQPRIRVTTSTSSSADLICAEVQDPAFDLRPLDERRFMRMACPAERESEAQEELLRQSGALDPPEPPDDADAYEPEFPEPYDPGYP